MRNLREYPITRQECVRALREAAGRGLRDQGTQPIGDVSPLALRLVADMLEREMEGAGLDGWLADYSTE